MWISSKTVLVTLTLANIRYYWRGRTASYRVTGCSLEETRFHRPDTLVQQQTHVLGWLPLSSLPHLQSILGKKGEAEFYFKNTNNKSNNHTTKVVFQLLMLGWASYFIRLLPKQDFSCRAVVFTSKFCPKSRSDSVVCIFYLPASTDFSFFFFLWRGLPRTNHLFFLCLSSSSQQTDLGSGASRPPPLSHHLIRKLWIIFVSLAINAC